MIGLGLTIYHLKRRIAERLAIKFNKMWVAAEILLFVLIGASVNLAFALKAGISGILLALRISNVQIILTNG